MHRVRLAVAVLSCVVGAVWIGQGIGLVPGSVMTGDRFWAGAGVVAVGFGVYLAWDALRRR
jgi:hypothetical protein